MDSDYDHYNRKDGSSMKYRLALKYKQPKVNPDNAIVVSHADMEFKFSPGIYEELKNIIGEPHFGYTYPKPEVWSAIDKWVKNRYLKDVQISTDNTILWHNMLIVYNSILHLLTKPGDNILVFTPSYYRFLVQAKFFDRNLIEVELTTKNHRFEIDFQDLQKKMNENDIKLFVLINPHNPCGRIWSYQQLEKIKNLVLKHKCFLFSDEIYSDAVEPQENEKIQDKFISMLRFEDIHQQLIYASSYSKTWNSSGMSISYSVIFNKQIHKKMKEYMDLGMVGYPSAISYSLIQAIYNTQASLNWRKRTINYVNENFALFRKLCEEKLPKLYFYDLQCSYLCLVDFKEYGVKGKDLEDLFSSVDVCPTFTDQFFVQEKPRTLIRFNMACNKQIIPELVSRIQKMLKKQ